MRGFHELGVRSRRPLDSRPLWLSPLVALRCLTVVAADAKGAQLTANMYKRAANNNFQHLIRDLLSNVAVSVKFHFHTVVRSHPVCDATTHTFRAKLQFPSNVGLVICETIKSLGHHHILDSRALSCKFSRRTILRQDKNSFRPRLPRTKFT